jgi:plastocyanin
MPRSTKVHRSTRLPRRLALAAPAALALALLATGCGTSGAKLGVSEVTAASGNDGVQRATIEAHSFYFKPNRIVVEANRPVELTLRFKNWFAPHNVTCDHPESGIAIDAGVGAFSFGGSKRIRFTPTVPGSYDFYCGVDSHMKKGMTGTIVVK